MYRWPVRRNCAAAHANPHSVAHLQWLVAAFGAGSLWKLLNQLQGGGGVRPQNAAFVALAAWALYSRHTLLVALAVMAGHMAAELVS